MAVPATVYSHAGSVLSDAYTPESQHAAASDKKCIGSTSKTQQLRREVTFVHVTAGYGGGHRATDSASNAVVVVKVRANQARSSAERGGFV